VRYHPLTTTVSLLSRTSS